MTDIPSPPAPARRYGSHHYDCCPSCGALPGANHESNCTSRVSPPAPGTAEADADLILRAKGDNWLIEAAQREIAKQRERAESAIEHSERIYRDFVAVCETNELDADDLLTAIWCEPPTDGTDGKTWKQTAELFEFESNKLCTQISDLEAAVRSAHAELASAKEENKTLQLKILSLESRSRLLSDYIQKAKAKIPGIVCGEPLADAIERCLLATNNADNLEGTIRQLMAKLNAAMADVSIWHKATCDRDEMIAELEQENVQLREQLTAQHCPRCKSLITLDQDIEAAVVEMDSDYPSLSCHAALVIDNLILQRTKPDGFAVLRRLADKIDGDMLWPGGKPNLFSTSMFHRAVEATGIVDLGNSVKSVVEFQRHVAQSLREIADKPQVFTKAQLEPWRGFLVALSRVASVDEQWRK